MQHPLLSNKGAVVIVGLVTFCLVKQELEWMLFIKTQA
jgi:hypothetical protein